METNWVALRIDQKSGQPEGQRSRRLGPGPEQTQKSPPNMSTLCSLISDPSHLYTTHPIHLKAGEHTSPAHASNCQQTDRQLNPRVIGMLV